MFRDDRVEREEESSVVGVFVDSVELDKVGGLDDETVPVFVEYICLPVVGVVVDSVELDKVGGLDDETVPSFVKSVCFLVVAVVLVTRVSHMVPVGRGIFSNYKSLVFGFRNDKVLEHIVTRHGKTTKVYNVLVIRHINSANIDNSATILTEISFS